MYEDKREDTCTLEQIDKYMDFFEKNLEGKDKELIINEIVSEKLIKWINKKFKSKVLDPISNESYIKINTEDLYKKFSDSLNLDNM